MSLLRVAALAAGLVLPAGSPTSLHVYSPFATGAHVSRHARGHCWTGSLADQRRDAWRCFMGNFILDPCFARAGTGGGAVLCAESPWSRVIRLALTKRLPVHEANPARPLKRQAPWALRLVNGRRCAKITGATNLVAGKPITYSCAGGGALLGLPDRRSAAWTISFARAFQARSSTKVRIDQAWW